MCNNNYGLFWDETIFIILYSVSLSSEFVASSKTRIISAYKALAIAILCLWPPDKLIPLSPIIVSNFSSKVFINSLHWDNSKALSNLFLSIFFISLKLYFLKLLHFEYSNFVKHN